MTQTIGTGFEDGTNGSAYTLDTRANGSGPVADNTNPCHGSLCVKELGSGSYQYVQGNFATAASAFRVRYAFAQDTALTAQGTDFQAYADTTSFASTNRALQVVRIATNVFRVLDSTGATVHTFTTTLPTDKSWVVIELQVVCGTSANATINGRMYTAADPGTILDSFTSSTFTTTATAQSFHLGKVTSGAFTPSTGTTYHDDFAVDDASSGWIGPFVDTPIANAGADQTHVEPYSTVTLDGSGSNDPGGVDLTYAWTQTGGTTVTLSDSTAELPTFTAPATLDGDTLTFSLTVSNGTTSSSPATTTVTVAAHTMWQITNPTGPVLAPIKLTLV